jgi:predicted Zn-dependent protease
MDALAMLLRANGEAAESKQWAARAGAEWQRRLSLAPEAAYGHALEHELLFGTPKRALELARANLAARPFGESRVLLASAFIANGRYGEALAQLDRAEASGWHSAPLYALRAQVLALTDRPGEAARARDAATALNPRIFAPETPLVWFSHG